MDSYSTFEANTFTLNVTWTGVGDLTGATVVALARRASSVDVLELTGSVADGPGRVTRATAPSDFFAEGEYLIQIIVTLDGVTDTYECWLAVSESLEAVA